jgi:hypothetical protein
LKKNSSSIYAPMLKKGESLAIDLLTLGGLATFFIFGKTLNLWLLLPTIFFSLFLLAFPKGASAIFDHLCFLPYASGLLIWPMRFFYWDRFDFSNRIHNLLLLAGFFSVWLIFRQQRWWGKIRCHFNSLALKKRLRVIFIVSELLFIAASAIITRKGVALVGDEPHYLAISQSLARDGDLNVFNQYFRDGFKEFLAVEKLDAHGTFGLGYKKLYSYHLPGLSFTLLPFFLVRLPQTWLYFLMRSYLGIFGAMLAVLVYLFCIKLWQRRDLAFYTVMAFTLTVPVFFHSFHIFPEIQAMLLILAALYLLLFAKGRQSFRFLFAGLLLGATIFWGVKYALFIYPFTLGFSGYWLWKKNYRPGLLLLVFPLFFQVLFFYYLHSAYGSFSPNAMYYGMLNPEQKKEFLDTILTRISLKMRLETLLDYFFDQRDGLLLYNPLYFFAFPGLLLAIKKIKRYRYHLLIALPAIIFVLNHAFSTIRPGYCPQARYLTPVTWALFMLILIYYRESRNPFLKKMILAMPLYSFFIVVYQTVQPMTLYQPTTHDTLVRPGLLFLNWSNIYCKLPNLLPSYIKADNSGYLPNFLFLAFGLLLLIFALCRCSVRNIRGAPLMLFLAIFSLSSLFPRPDLSSPQQLPDSHGHPGFIYFSPQPTAQMDDRTWIFSNTENCSILIETRLPLKGIELQLENRSGQGALHLDIAAFDEKSSQQLLPVAGTARIDLQQPPFKKVKNSYFYQLYLRGKVSGPASAPALLLRVHSH